MQKQSSQLAPLDSAQRYEISEAMAYLRTSRATIYQLIAMGTLRVIRQGKRTYVPGSEIARLSKLDS
jgi:excisionase family DNA binding protein